MSSLPACGGGAGHRPAEPPRLFQVAAVPKLRPHGDLPELQHLADVPPGGAPLLCHYCGWERRHRKRARSAGASTSTSWAWERTAGGNPAHPASHGRMARVDRDSTRRRGSLRTVLLDFAEGRLDVLVAPNWSPKDTTSQRDAGRRRLRGCRSGPAGLSLGRADVPVAHPGSGQGRRGQSPGRVIIQAHYPTTTRSVSRGTRTTRAFSRRRSSSAGSCRIRLLHRWRRS